MSVAHTREVTIEQDGEIRISGLPIRVGQLVRVFVIPEKDYEKSPDRYPLRGTLIKYDEPFGPASSPEDWEANR